MSTLDLRQRRMLIVITSPSGGGKTTVVRALLVGDPSLAYSVSTTTRAPRPREVENEAYIFVSREEFQALIEQGQFLEWADVYGNLYGTRRDLVRRLLDSGRDVVLDVDVQGAMSIRRQAADAVLIFLVPPTMAALEERLRRRAQDSEDEIARRLDAAREEIRTTASFDYLVLNDRLEQTISTVRTIIAAERCRASRSTLASELEGVVPQPPAGPSVPFGSSIVFVSQAMAELVERAERVAHADSPVLLLGESGTGKEILAEAIHRASRRTDGPLVRVNCGAIPRTLLESQLFGHLAGSFTGAVGDHEGLFRAADAGTIFLDEIGVLPLDLQVKLLRVLQDGEVRSVGATQAEHVDVRLIAATNRDLAAAVAAGQFREDLFYRLSVVSLKLPPLRERPEDIPALVDHFLRRLAGKGHALKSVDPEAMEILMAFDWPGNVRQLENAIEHAVVLSEGDRIGPDDLPDRVRRPPYGGAAPTPSPASEKGGETLRETEIAAIRRALDKTGDNLTHAGRLLGITRRALSYRLAKYGIHTELRRGRPRRT